MTSVPDSPADPVRVGPVGFPERTLIGPIWTWTQAFLLQPDGHDAGEQWDFTNEQLRFLAWWYAVDEQGRFVYRYAMLRRMKGWGKDPVGAVVCAVEFVGPCRFDGWAKGGETTDWGYRYAAGEPLVKRHPAAWVQTAAVSKDQTRNTMTLFPGLFSPAAVDAYGIDLGKEIIYSKSGGRIEAVTSSPRALEGGRGTFVLKNETHHWLKSNDGHDMAAVISRNAAKSRDASARAMAISNAHQPGEDSDAEHDWDAWQKIADGRSRATGFLYDSIEAPPDVELANRDSLRAGLLAARGESTWLDVDRLIEEIYDPRTPPSTSRRFYLNQIVAAEDAWVAPQEWDALADGSLVLADNDIITLGFDGSKSDDHCALVACRVEDGAWFTIGVWDPAKYDGEAPRGLIDGTVRRTFDRYDVVGFFSDLHPWESYVDAWAEDFGRDLCVKASSKHAVAWDMRSRTKEFTTEGAERLHDEIVEQAFRHDGEPQTRLHVHNARRRPNQWGVSFGKEHRESSRKIDSLPAGVLSRMARRAYLALPSSKQRRQRSGRASFV